MIALGAQRLHFALQLIHLRQVLGKLCCVLVQLFHVLGKLGFHLLGVFFGGHARHTLTLHQIHGTQHPLFERGKLIHAQRQCLRVRGVLSRFLNFLINFGFGNYCYGNFGKHLGLDCNFRHGEKPSTHGQ